jgi:hypothetical protein
MFANRPIEPMTLLTYTFPAAVAPRQLNLLVPLAFLLAGSWLLVSATTDRFRLGGLRLFVVGLSAVGLVAWVHLQEDRRRFSTIEVAVDRLKIVRSNPDETVLITRDEVATVTFDLITFKHSPAIHCNLQLTTTSGKRFISNDREDAECKRYRHEIAQALAL